jgi:hypothetical protein
MAFSRGRSLLEPPRPRLPGPRAARRPRADRRPAPSGRSTASTAARIDDKFVELVRAGLSDVLAQQAFRDAVAELTDEDVLQCAEVLRAAVASEVLVAPTGSTRGVRRNSTTGEIERF